MARMTCSLWTVVPLPRAVMAIDAETWLRPALPEMVAVPLPLSWNRSPKGSGPNMEYEVARSADTVNDPRWPRTKRAVVGEVKVGAGDRVVTGLAATGSELRPARFVATT